MTKTIYHTQGDDVLSEDDEVGEVEAFFDEAGNVLASWAMNDANWSSEYMDELLENLGIEVASIPDHLKEVAADHFRKTYGY